MHDGSGVNIEVDQDAPPLAIYKLGQLVYQAVNNELFDRELAGSEGFGHAFSATLSCSKDVEVNLPEPFWHKVKDPIDEFRLVNDIPTIVLSFDFDGPVGILSTSDR